MSNRITVMSQGRIVQEGSPREIYERPRSDFVARFVGAANFLSGEVAGSGRDGVCVVKTRIGPVEAPCPAGVAPGGSLTLTVRPENIRVHPSPPGSVRNLYDGEVEQVMFLGEYLECRVSVGGHSLVTRQHPTIRLRQGDRVHVEVPPDLVTAISDSGVSGEGALAPVTA